jgi:hypothetical protein
MSTVEVWQRLFAMSCEDPDALAFMGHLGGTHERNVILSLVVVAWIGGSSRDECETDGDLLTCLKLGDMQFASCRASDDEVLAELAPTQDKLHEIELHSGGRAYSPDLLQKRQDSFPLPDRRHHREH